MFFGERSSVLLQMKLILGPTGIVSANRSRNNVNVFQIKMPAQVNQKSRSAGGLNVKSRLFALWIRIEYKLRGLVKKKDGSGME